ncbi:unnamed protein product [Urochloa humidicola]
MDDGTDSHPTTGSPLPHGEVLDPNNWGSAEPSRESPEVPAEHPRSPRRPPPRSMDDGAADTSPASSSEHSCFMDPRTGLRFFTESALLQSINRDRRLRGSGTSQPRTRTHVRQSVLYSDSRPRRSRPRRPALAEERTHEETSIELGKAVTELPAIEALSLSDPPLLTPQTETGEETDDDCAWVPTTGETVPFSDRPKGLSLSMILSLADSLIMTVSNEEVQRHKPYPDEDPEELQRRIDEYLDASPCIDLSVASDTIKAIEDANLNAHATELGKEPQPPSVLTEQTSVATERHEVSMAWMNEEVMLCFKMLIEISPDLAELEDYCLDELRHQCFNVESYDKVYHHYNFTVRMKMPNSVDWTVELYFAEVKEIFGTKHYLCYPLDPNENGLCYACRNQGVEDLRHPAIDLFETGSPDASACSLWYTYD